MLHLHYTNSCFPVCLVKNLQKETLTLYASSLGKASLGEFCIRHYCGVNVCSRSVTECSTIDEVRFNGSRGKINSFSTPFVIWSFFFQFFFIYLKEREKDKVTGREDVPSSWLTPQCSKQSGRAWLKPGAWSSSLVSHVKDMAPDAFLLPPVTSKKVVSPLQFFNWWKP